METFIDNKDLEKLYEDGKSRKYQIPKNAIDKFFKAIEILQNSERIEDLWSFTSFKFEKLKGYHNRFSMRLNDKYRLELRIDFQDTPPTTGVVYIEEISNHYD